jgi:hypothetical protein
MRHASDQTMVTKVIKRTEKQKEEKTTTYINRVIKRGMST